MEQVVLNAQLRTQSGKGPARRLRKEGIIPGVMYKGGDPTFSLSVQLDDLKQALEGGRNTLITLKLETSDGESEHVVMVRKLQRDPVHEHVLHVDFIGIDLGKPLDVEIPLELVGIPVGVTTGGILQQNLRRLKIRCLPSAIPRRVTLDVTSLQLGESLHVSDLELPEGAEGIEDPEAAVASVQAPELEPVEEEVPEEEALEEGEAAEAAEKTEKDEKKEEGQPGWETPAKNIKLHATTPVILPQIDWQINWEVYQGQETLNSGEDIGAVTSYCPYRAVAR